MKTILFIQRSGMPWHGVMSMSAALLQRGYYTDLLLASEHKRNLLSTVRKINPHYIAFPTVTDEYDWIMKAVKEFREYLPFTKIVFGGPHATLYPDTLNNWGVVIRGEGEYSELTDSFNMPVEDLDALPMQDRSIYYKYSHLANSSSKQFITGRGCPYKCAFCVNHRLHELFGNTAVRRRSPENVIAEILNVARRWPLKSLSFTDDVFTLNSKWLTHFLDIYKHEVKLPFMCNTRVNLVNDTLIDQLKDAGCYGVEMGVESGSVDLRDKVLQKGHFTNDTAIKAGKTVKSRNMILKTYNMVGIPGESVRDVYDTIKLNNAMGTDHASCSFLMPFPGYAISKHFGEVQLTDSIYKPMKCVPNEIVNLQTFFTLAAQNPKLLPLVKVLAKIQPNVLYSMASKAFYGIFMSKVHKLTLGDMWRYARHIDPRKV